jgi:aspartyl-tRNA(Asn)/glutamyl-tRNA(Gln) amidotransferase subunit A
MFDTITSLCKQLQSKTVSSLELTQSYLQQIQQSRYNAFISVCEESALAQAKAADKAINAGSAGPLTGIPMAHKDIFCTKGIKTSCASKMLDNFIAPYDAHVVTQLANAGMVCLGKTNMDEFAMGSSNENSYYGSVHNPWKMDRIAGGSSGGSAAAVAAGLAPLATGTDTGGSIRQPAAMCGITGIKPTYGRVSRYGMVAFASSLDQGGPLARTAEDCAVVLNAMAGFDPRDSTSVKRDVPDYTARLNQSIKGLKIGVPNEFFAEGIDPQVAQTVQTALKQLESAGAQLIEISLAHNHHAVGAYYVIAPAECSANLSRYDGVRFGHRCDDPKDLLDMYLRSRAEGFGWEVKRRILTGTYALSSGYYDAYYRKAQQVRRLISQDFAAAFEQVDVIMGPTYPSVAFDIGEKIEDPISMYLADIYTVAVNLAGLPGLSVPCGFVNGLPVGLQMIGKHFDEAHLLNIAHQYQHITDWHQHQPKQEVSA